MRGAFTLLNLAIVVLATHVISYAQQSNRVPVRTSLAWHGAEAEGRLLWVSEQSVTLELGSRNELQVGWQRFVAKGRVRTNRFSTSARYYALNHVLRDDEESRLVFSVQRLEGGEGTADVAEGLFTYVAPRVDTFSAISIRRQAGRESGYTLSYSRIRAGTETAETFGFAVRSTQALSERLDLKLGAALYADRHVDTAYRPVVIGALEFQVWQGARAELSVTFAPRGLPLAGTSVEGLTAFALYRPGSLVEGWRDRAAGYMSLRVTASSF